ncbi:MAG: cupin domain-containing protein [Chloroflexi bacterium]|nr:cupin domain-containing protein [Chloroflexota bacterium]
MSAARSNDFFRREVLTGEHEQVVVMTIPARDEIGMETHPDTDQVLVLVEGTAEASLDGRTSRLEAGDLVLVHAGVRHNVTNAGTAPLRLITIYAPPHHRPGTVHRTKAEAEAAEG